MEIVKSKKAEIIIAALSLAFMLLANAYSAQISVERLGYYSEIDSSYNVRRNLTQSLFLASPLGNQPIELNIISDSIDEKTITMKLYIYFPKGIKINNSRIQIDHSDGTKEVFNQNSIDEQINYVEYEMSTGTFNNFMKKGVTFITIKDIGKFTCSKPNYFANFLQSL